MVLRYWLEGLYVEASLERLLADRKSPRRRTDQATVQQIELLQPKLMLAATAVVIDSSTESQAPSDDPESTDAAEQPVDGVWLAQTGPWWNFPHHFDPPEQLVSDDSLEGAATSNIEVDESEDGLSESDLAPDTTMTLEGSGSGSGAVEASFDSSGSGSCSYSYSGSMSGSYSGPCSLSGSGSFSGSR